MPLNHNDGVATNLIAGNLGAIAHHNRQWRYELGNQVEEMGQTIVDKVVGTATVNEDEDIVTRDRTHDAKGG